MKPAARSARDVRPGTPWTRPQPDDAHVLSGSVPDVEATLDRWGVSRSRDPHNGEITHPQLVYVVDRLGRIAFVSTGDADVLVAECQRRVDEAVRYTREHFKDPTEIRDWTWTDDASPRQ